MVDFTDCPMNPYQTYGGLNGKKIGIVYQNKPYMLKLESEEAREEYDTSRIISEYIGCHVMQTLGIPAQDTILGVYRRNGKEYRAVACEDLEQDGYKLRPFSTILNACLEASSLGGDRHRLIRLLRAIDEQSLIDPAKVKEFYWNQFIGDALIANPSRNLENWGFLVNEETQHAKISPVYSCGASLYPQLKQEDAKKIFSSEVEFNHFVFSSRSAMKGVHRKINYLYFLSFGLNADCTAALFRIAPRVDMAKIEAIIDGIDCLSDMQKRFYKTVIRARKERILDFSAHELHNAQAEVEKEDKTEEAEISARFIDKEYVQCLMERIGRIQLGNGKIEEHELIEAADYLEEGEDQRIAEEAYQEYLDSGGKSTPIEEFWKELDDEDSGINQQTVDAIREMENDMKNPNLKTYDSFEELLEDKDSQL